MILGIKIIIFKLELSPQIFYYNVLNPLYLGGGINHFPWLQTRKLGQTLVLGWVTIVSTNPDLYIYFSIMAIRLVEFSNGRYKIRKVFCLRINKLKKLLNFENWISGGFRSFKKSERYPPKKQRKLLNFENWISGGLTSFEKSEKK